jgi:hypothetical protein
MIRTFTTLGLCAGIIVCASTVAAADADPYKLEPGQQLIKRDRDGSRTGTIEKGYGGELIERDRSGKRTGTIEPGYGGEYIRRDRSGKRTGTIERQ